MAAHHRNEKGFTLLEVTFVLTLLAILTVAFIGEMTESNVERIAGIEALKSHLRYAQSRAMSTSKNWYVLFSPDTPPKSYALYESGGGVKSFPGQSGTSVELVGGIAIGDGTYSAGLVVNFDRLGRPFIDAGGTVPQNVIRNIATYSTGLIKISPETGYIP